MALHRNLTQSRGTWVWVIGGALIVALVAGIYWYATRAPADGSAPGSEQTPGKGGKGGKAGVGRNQQVPVVAVAAKTGDIGVYLNSLGSVTPLNTVTVRTRIDGQLMQVLFKEGQIVRPGDLLAQIDPRTYQAQLETAEGQMARDQALLKNARLDLERYRTLFQQDSIAKQQVDTQDSLVKQYEGTVKVDQAAIDTAKLQLIYCRITAPVGGRLGLRQVDAGNIVHASDTNGIVVITQLQPITVVYTIPEDSVPSVLKRVQAGEKLLVEAWDRAEKNKLATGSLLTLDNQIDPTTGTVKLKAQFPNGDYALFPMQFVNTHMLVETQHDVIIIPTAAIQRGTPGTFVYVVTADGAAKPADAAKPGDAAAPAPTAAPAKTEDGGKVDGKGRRGDKSGSPKAGDDPASRADHTVSVRVIKLGPTQADRAAVESGLAAGELVVVDGADKLREGAKVELASRSAGAAGDAGKGKNGAHRKKGDGSAVSAPGATPGAAPGAAAASGAAANSPADTAGVAQDQTNMEKSDDTQKLTPEQRQARWAAINARIDKGEFGEEMKKLPEDERKKRLRDLRKQQNGQISQ